MKKTWIKGLLGITSILVLAACGAEGTGDSGSDVASSDATSSTDVDTSADTTTDGDKLAAIKEKGVLTIATTADYPPYEWHLVKDGQDTIVGFDIDIAQAIADEFGVKLVVKDMDFNGLIPSLSTGKVDLILAGMNPTAERAESVDFTDIYITTQDVVLIRKEDEDKYKSQADLADADWATQKSTIQEEYLLENFPDSDIQSVGKWGTAILSLKTGRVDGILMVETVAKQYAKENDDLVIADLELDSTPNESAIAVQKGNEEFLETVNGILNALQEDGTVEELILKNTQLMEENTIE